MWKQKNIKNDFVHICWRINIYAFIKIYKQSIQYF